MFDFFKRQEEKPVLQNIEYKQQTREKHQWQLLFRTYAAPVRSFEGMKLENLPVETVQKLSLGVTTYVWECSLTGDLRTEELLGSDSDTLQDILAKANQYGKQTIRDENGNIYTIDRHISPTDLTSLPVRKM